MSTDKWTNLSVSNVLSTTYVYKVWVQTYQPNILLSSTNLFIGGWWREDFAWWRVRWWRDRSLVASSLVASLLGGEVLGGEVTGYPILLSNNALIPKTIYCFCYCFLYSRTVCMMNYRAVWKFYHQNGIDAQLNREM